MTSSVETLLEALPYIREFHGRTIVIKYGGAAMRDDELREAFARDVVLLKYVGMNPIIVHGGGPEITHYMERMGMEVKFVEGLRVSDAETVEVAKMVLLGKINSDILTRLNRHGQPAVGLGGEDGSLFEVKPVGQSADVGFVGEIDNVNVDVIEHIAEDYIPVIASVGADREGASYNVNADEAAGKVAAALPAHKAIFLTDVDGWLRDPADPESRISQATADEVRDALDGVEGGMRPKLDRLRRRDLRRGGGRAHRRRPPPAHTAARALHRRRNRNQDHRMKLADLQELESRWVMQTYVRAPVELVRGEGARVWDSDGREYLDFLAGISVCSVGHCHPAVVEAVREQVSTLTHTSNLYLTEGGVRLAQRLCESSLGGRAFLCNSGTEANECAIKLVRKHAHGRGIEEPEVVVLEGAFHGRTMGSLSATPGLSDNESFAPYLPGFRAVPRDDAAALRAAVGERTAAVMLEPIQGETGVHVVPDEVIAAAREACDAAGALLLFDEIQTGMGRTGSLWAYEQLPARPDVMSTAKALGGGLPVGACVTTPETSDVLERGDHGSTFAGGPLIAAASLAAFGVIDDPDLLRRVRDLGGRLTEGLEEIDVISEVRGRGLMIGARLEGVAASDAASRLLSEGLIVNPIGEDTLRFLPPLMIGEADVDEALALLGRVLS